MFKSSLLPLILLIAVADRAVAGADPHEPQWKKTIAIDPNDVKGGIAAARLNARGFVNYYTGRWPYISFIGGMAIGNRSEELEFFYSEPFKWRTTILDYVLENGGVMKGTVKFNKRGEYVIAPKGKGEEVFFGKP